MDLKITPSDQTIVKPTALGTVANTDTKLLIYGLFHKGRVLAQDAVHPDETQQDFDSAKKHQHHHGCEQELSASSSTGRLHRCS